jgi:hypothetical protein
MDEMEPSFHKFRSLWPLQCSASDSVNPRRPFLLDVFVENESRDFDQETAPMDIEYGTLQLS